MLVAPRENGRVALGVGLSDGFTLDPSSEDASSVLWADFLAPLSASGDTGPTSSARVRNIVIDFIEHPFLLTCRRSELFLSCLWFPGRKLERT